MSIYFLIKEMHHHQKVRRHQSETVKKSLLPLGLNYEDMVQALQLQKVNREHKTLCWINTIPLKGYNSLTKGRTPRPIRDMHTKGLPLVQRL